jgi:hypothetical protein
VQPVHVRTKRRHIPEDGNTRNYRCENLKSVYKMFVKELLVGADSCTVAALTAGCFWQSLCFPKQNKQTKKQKEPNHHCARSKELHCLSLF